MIVETLQPGQILRPTKDATTTYPRKIERNDRGSFMFRRILQDGADGELMWAGHASMKAWIRKYAAIIDGTRDAPPFEAGHKGIQFFAKDSDGQWHYVNHAGTWQACPPPAS